MGGHKIDVRGEGGYVVGAGSVHPDGTLYEWLVSPEDVDFADFPSALAALIDERLNPSSSTGLVKTAQPSVNVPEEPGVERFVALAFFEACRELAKSEEGHRNDDLFKASVRIASYVAAAQLAWDFYAAGFRDVARKLGLELDEIDRTLASAWASGSAEPTQWVEVARDFIFLSNPERFYHVPSRKILRSYGFNSQYGHLFWGKEAFSRFLLDFGYIRMAYDIDYQPLKPAGFFERDGVTYWNTYQPSSVVAVEGDPRPLKEFMEYLIPVPEEREHLERVIAYTVRNPGRKVRHAILLRSAVQGGGKSMLGTIWGALLGESNVRKTTSAEMSSAYQSWAIQTLLIICEELNIGQGKAAYNSLKDLITSDRARVNEKYLPQRDWDIFGTYLFLTNLEVPLLIEERDRRVFFIDSSAEKRDASYYTDFVAWWGQNLGVIRWYLDQIDLSDFDPHAAPPMTAAKRALIEDGRSDLAKDLAFHIGERNGLFDRDVIALRDARLQLDLDRRCSERSIGKALTDLGAVKLGQTWVGDRRESLWAIRNVELWSDSPASERAAEYRRTRGLLADLDHWWLAIASADRWPAAREYLECRQPLIVTDGDLVRFLNEGVELGEI